MKWLINNGNDFVCIELIITGAQKSSWKRGRQGVRQLDTEGLIARVYIGNDSAFKTENFSHLGI